MAIAGWEELHNLNWESSLGSTSNESHIWENYNSTLLSSAPYLQGKILSNSFGIHIGSVVLSIPPLVYLGGCDQSRVLGNSQFKITQFKISASLTFQSALLDIGI